MPRVLLASVLSLSLLQGCRERPPERTGARPEDSAALLRGYADLALAEYSDAAEGARALLGAVESFVREPSPSRLKDARDAWIAARIPYAQTETFRFYGGPIDRVEMLVNTWPIDESYIDSRSGRPGIINDAASFPDISEGTLAALNMKEGETSVTTGFHAIEFLLWGEDHDPNGPGNRLYTDYVEGEARRRGIYLLAATRLLSRNLEEVAAAWRDGDPSNYRARFLALPPPEALGLAIKGMGALSGPELAGERLTVAYATKDQENEHSCFSDNTHDDILFDAVGIENVCTGKYRRKDGSVLERPGLCPLVSSVSPTVGKTLADQISASVVATKSIPSPFDRAILGKDTDPGRIAIQHAITLLETQAGSLSQAASVLGARLPLTVTAARR